MATEQNNTVTENNENVESEKRYSGRVKWFNNRLGYGFITYKDDNNESKDIFSHHSQIRPQRSTYRTLYQGEYVEFSLKDSRKEGKDQASNITGLNMGPLYSDSKKQNSFEKYKKNAAADEPH